MKRYMGKVNFETIQLNTLYKVFENNAGDGIDISSLLKMIYKKEDNEVYVTPFSFVFSCEEPDKIFLTFNNRKRVRLTIINAKWIEYINTIFNYESDKMQTLFCNFFSEWHLGKLIRWLWGERKGKKIIMMGYYIPRDTFVYYFERREFVEYATDSYVYTHQRLGKQLTPNYEAKISLLVAADKVCNELLRVDAAFISEFSRMQYESRHTSGIVYFVSEEMGKKLCNITFDRGVCLTKDNIRMLRKYFEMVGNGYMLVCEVTDKYSYVMGLTNKIVTDTCVLKITGSGKWELEENGIEKLEGLDGTYTLSKSDFDFSEFEGMGVDRCVIEEIIKDAMKQHHGTIVIVTNNAENIAEYYCTKERGIRIKEPVNLYQKEQLINCISSIDGAILLNEQGKCFAVGIILDGLAPEKGNAARGARFNSAYTYISSKIRDNQWIDKKDKAVAIIISEDGMVDVIGIEAITKAGFYKDMRERHGRGANVYNPIREF